MNESARGGPPARVFMGLCVAVLFLGAAFRWGALDQFPPGLHYDEAAYGLQAIELASNPRIEVFFPAFTGREPMFIYIEAVALALAGHSVFVLRAVSAAIGIFSIAATIAVGRRMFGDWVGLLAGALLAVSFWHITIARMAYRAGLLAALGPIAILCIWRAWEKPTPGRSILAGVSIGILGYTYVSVRLLPFGLLLFVVLMFAAGSLRNRKRWAHAALVALVAMAVAAPLLLYFRDHPNDFANRFDQTTAIAGDEVRPNKIVDGVVDTLRMYGLRGDVLQKYNLPLRPALDPILASLLFIGILRAWAGWRLPQCALMLAWLGGTLAPGFITNDSPNFLRLIGSAPPSYLLASLGAATLAGPVRGSIRWIAHQRFSIVGGTRSSTVIAIACLSLILVEGLITYRDYFRRWAPSTETFTALDGDLAAVGVLARTAASDQPTLISSEHFRHPTVAYIAETDFATFRWFDGRNALVLPSSSQVMRILVPTSANPPFHEVLGTPVDRIQDRAGQVAAAAFLIDGSRNSAIPVNRLNQSIRFAREQDPPIAELLALESASQAEAGSDLSVFSVWRLLVDSPNISIDVFAHALDQGGRRWGQRDISPYLTSEWRSGELLVVRSTIRLNPTAPPGPSVVQVGLNDPVFKRALSGQDSRGAALPRSSSQVPVLITGGSAIASIETDKIFVASMKSDSQNWSGPVADFGQARLRAATLPRQIAAGQVDWIDLLWEAKTLNPRGDVSILLRSAASQIDERSISLRELAEIDTSREWRTNEQIRDSRRFSPRRADAGTWDVVVQMDKKELTIGQIIVTAPPTQTGPIPIPQQDVEARFGDVARLVGIDRTAIGIRLIWQAIGPSDENLTVFVHGLDESDAILVQHDGQPDSGRQATRGWIDGDIVLDELQMTFPAAVTRLAIGLYDPSDGKRVMLLNGDSRAIVRLTPALP